MKLTKLFLLLASLCVMVVGSASSALAAGTNANLGVSVKVTNNCTITTVAVAFSDYDPIVTHLTTPDDSSTGSVTITCNKGGASSIALDLGSNKDTTQPRMTNGTDFLNYTLYSGSVGGTVWSGVSLPVTSPSQTATAYTVYGRIPPGQPASSGTYNDTVLATVNF